MAHLPAPEPRLRHHAIVRGRQQLLLRGFQPPPEHPRLRARASCSRGAPLLLAAVFCVLEDPPRVDPHVKIDSVPLVTAGGSDDVVEALFSSSLRGRLHPVVEGQDLRKFGECTTPTFWKLRGECSAFGLCRKRSSEEGKDRWIIYGRERGTWVSRAQASCNLNESVSFYKRHARTRPKQE